MKRIKFPHSYVLFFYIIIFVTILTYFVPAGSFERSTDENTGITYVLEHSYKVTEQKPVSPFGMFEGILEGMLDAADIIFFVFIVGGAYSIINKTGTLTVFIAHVANLNQKKGKRLIVFIMIIFSLCGTFLGTAEEALPFYPLFITIALTLGYDSFTGVAMVLLGTGAGFAAGILNPFTTGVAQILADLPLFSGYHFRFLTYLLLLIPSICYVLRYVKKIETNPTASITYAEDQLRNQKLDFNRIPSLENTHKRVLTIIFLSVLFLIYIVTFGEFNTTKMAALFIVMGILSGIVAKLDSSVIATEFIKGSSNIMYGALIIGLARSITVIMKNGYILDSLIFHLASSIEGFGKIGVGIGMFVVQSFINLFIPSGSGQAAAVIPIMKPIGDLTSLSRQTVVLAYQFGDGFSNIISPTSGYFMAALAIGRISWKKWAKWVLPLFLYWTIIGVLLIILSITVQLGPY
ncbi:YfcC family protein [Tindallia californiensis]|uniref:Uncharacterized membrane protein YfcC, ion transporter superfamily n=1 Tax=Tindallia californiensis TaxID=159292 RepID=A0A1H3L856_9FIRM|nr:AbgT family transporter [Tindallia californiensis]SDY60623.1 Uncharacterized membrane protein YfcC, ion transporter superfamily [Tindallia californiensis]